MKYVQSESCTSWQFKNIPEFMGGNMHPVFADCGCGLEISGEINPERDSFMHSFTDTSASDVAAYTEILGKSFTGTYKYSRDGNLFYQFSVPEGLLYVSFIENTGVTRIILDCCRTQQVKDFGCPDFTDVCGSTVFSQYSLHYDKMIRGTTCDCGMNYVYRLRDNSLIIIDGGEMEQSTDAAVDDYMCFLRELTGTHEKEKIRISLWLCTHPHNDHSDFFAKMLLLHSDEFTLERVAFNFPHPSNVRHSPSVFIVRDRITALFPDVKFLKLHSGNRFDIANADIEVLSAQEDALGIDPDDYFPGTNETSALISITADGFTSLFLADCGDENGSFLINSCSSETLKCDFLQAAHHGINKIFGVYDCIKAKKVLLPQCMMNMETRFPDRYSHLCKNYGQENILLAADKTDIFVLRNGTYEHKTRSHTGTPWDGSKW